METKEPQFSIDIWTVDGSSTCQSVTSASDIVLNPVCAFNDPFNKNTETCKYMLALCEVYSADGTPHVTNTRFELLKYLNNLGEEELMKYQPMFGIEQEYILLQQSNSF
jgi:glutamine synthetase